MTTSIEYALLAANVYGRSNDIGAQNVVRSVQNTLPMPAGWASLWTYDANDELDSANNTGFLATVYTNGPEVVIAFAGNTDENNKDWFDANIPAATGLVLAEQIAQAARMYQEVLNDPALANKPISFTGHSEGGGLASLMAVYFNRQATVFDEAFFRKSADSSLVIDPLRTYLQSNGLPVPLAFSAYIAGGVPTTEGVAPSPTRLARENNIHSYATQGEILSVLSDDALEYSGTILGAIAEFLVNRVLPPPIGGTVGDILKLAGNDIGKIKGTDNTIFDLHALRDDNLDWGWGLLGKVCTTPFFVDQMFDAVGNA